MAKLAALLVLAAPVLAAELPFAAQTVISGVSEDNPRFVTSGDLDGDGDLDVLSACSFSDQVIWYENDGNRPPGFTPHVVSNLAPGAMSVHPADLDGDGDLDILVASADDDTVGWYRNLDGAGSFGNRITISSAADGAQSVFAADLDSDGDLDVLSASFNDDTIAWYESDGATPPGFITRLIIEDPDGGGAMQGFADGARAVRAADVDGDGDLDVLSASALNNRVAWYESDGSSPPVFSPRVVTDFAGSASSLDVGDVNGDGRLDVVASAVLDDRVTWYVQNDFGGQFPWFHRLVTTVADGALSVQAVDVDRDGDVDVVVASFFDNTVSWYESTTGDAENWTERQITTTATGATSAHVADLDGDGDLDAVAAASTDDVMGWYENLAIHRSAFFPSQSLITADVDRPRSLYAVDLDGDGDQDVVSASFGDGAINWYESDGATSPLFTAHVIDADPGIAYSVVAEDLDNDGDIDVVAGFYSCLRWYENNGASPPVFALHNLETDTPVAFSVFAADLDGDGDHDVLAPASFNTLINWYENDGASPPGFTAHPISTTAPGTSSVSVADLDSDGDLDVLSKSSNSDDLLWYENDGASPPSFTPHAIPRSLRTPSTMFAVDLDGDGDLDILSASRLNPSVSWYENDGAPVPGFAERVVFAFSLSPTHTLSADGSVFPADLDTDGDLDLLWAYHQGIVWYANDGGSPPIFAPTTISPDRGVDIVAVDLDEDGDLDAISAQTSSDRVAWYPNRGGQFALPTGDLSQGFLLDGQVDDVLEIELHHRGRLGDSDLQLISLELLLESAPGVPLNDSEAMNLIQEIAVYLDDGSGAFEPLADTEVAAVSVINLSVGVLSIPFVSGVPLTLPVGSSKTLFVAVEMTADASSQTPSSFLLTHLTESSSTAEDAAHDIPLELEASPELTVGPIDTELSDTSCAAALDLVLIGDVVVDFPLACEAGRVIRAGGGFEIVGPLGAVTFRAGEGIALENGLKVETAGALTLEIDALLLPP